MKSSPSEQPYKPETIKPSSSFRDFETESSSQAVSALFEQALPNLPIVTDEAIRQICSKYLNYDAWHGQRHICGSASYLEQLIAYNLKNVHTQLPFGQQVVSFKVLIQSELQFAAITLFIGDMQGNLGYAFSVRLWKTADRIFVLGWKGFLLSL